MAAVAARWCEGAARLKSATMVKVEDASRKDCLGDYSMGMTTPRYKRVHLVTEQIYMKLYLF